MDAIKEEIQRSAILDKKNKDILIEMYEKSLLEISDIELENMFNKLIEKKI
jgi:hypothetical protein